MSASIRPELAHVVVLAFQRRADWLSSRVSDTISATEAAMALGRSPYGTAWDLWERKRGGGAPVSTDVTTRGHRWESAVLAEYGDESGGHVLTPAEACGAARDSIVVLCHPQYPWLRQSPDAFAMTSRGFGQVEAKTAMRAGEWAPEPGVVIDQWDDAYAELVPPHYAIQGYVQLAVTGLPWVDLCALVPTPTWLKLRWVRLQRDEGTQAALIGELDQWRQRHLVEGEPPPIDESDACNRHFSAAFPPRQHKPVRIATDEEAARMTELAEIRARQKADEKRAGQLRNELIASAEGLRLRLDGTPRSPYGQPQKTTGEGSAFVLYRFLISR